MTDLKSPQEGFGEGRAFSFGRRSRFPVGPFDGRAAISWSDTDAARVVFAAVIIAADDYWRQVRLAVTVRDDDAAAP